MLKKLLIGIVILIVILAVGAIGWLSYMGCFSNINITEKDLGPLTIVYVSHKGPYSNVGSDMMMVGERLKKEFNITSSKSIGIYYDDPSKVKPESLRSDVGILLEGKDSSKADAIMKKMKVKIMFQKKYVTAEFPIRNMMSYMIGVIKVYPKMMEYMKARSYRMAPAIEIYDMKAKKITYGFEIKK